MKIFMKHNRRLPYSLSRQQGATLVIALIILLVMSMIGIANMQSSTMQERMASNNKQKTFAKYAAESALTAAENWLTVNIKSSDKLSEFNGANTGLYSLIPVASNAVASPRADAIADVLDPKDWGSVTAAAGKIIDDSLGVEQPQYVIEYLGRDLKGTANKVVNVLDADKTSDNSNKPYMFKITAIGWSKDKNIYAILESTYKTGSGDYFVY